MHSHPKNAEIQNIEQRTLAHVILLGGGMPIDAGSEMIGSVYLDGAVGR